MKKRNKAYRPGRMAGDNIKLKMQPWKVKAIMDPLLAIVEQLEQDGTIDVASNGVAIAGVVEAFEIHERRFGVDLHLDGLRKLGKALQIDMPINEHQTAAARVSLQHIRAASLEMTAGYARDLIKDFQIKEGLEQVREAA